MFGPLSNWYVLACPLCYEADYEFHDIICMYIITKLGRLIALCGWFPIVVTTSCCRPTGL